MSVASVAGTEEDIWQRKQASNRGWQPRRKTAA